MTGKCSSANRCAQIHCSKCAKRYARRVARDFIATSNGQIYAVTIAASVNDLHEFAQWRISVWNRFTYRRQICQWWLGVSMRVWLSNDGSIRGVVALASITEREFATILCRWTRTLRLIKPDTLFNELYEVVQPGMIMDDDPDHARYQPRQMTVRPRRARIPKQSVSAPLYNPFDEPMPVLIV